MNSAVEAGGSGGGLVRNKRRFKQARKLEKISFTCEIVMSVLCKRLFSNYIFILSDDQNFLYESYRAKFIKGFGIF